MDHRGRRSLARGLPRLLNVIAGVHEQGQEAARWPNRQSFLDVEPRNSRAGKYAAAKGGIVSLNRAAALEEARYGAMATLSTWLGEDATAAPNAERHARTVRLRIPMQRFAEPLRSRQS